MGRRRSLPLRRSSRRRSRSTAARSPTQYSVLQATDTIHSNDKLTLSASAGLSTATGNSGVSELASVAATWRPTSRDCLQRIVRAWRGGGHAGPPGNSERPGVAALRLQREGRVRQRAGPTAAKQLLELRAAHLHAPAARRQRFAHAVPPACKTACCCRCTSTASSSTSSASCRRAISPRLRPLYNSPAGCNAPPGTPIFGAAALLHDADCRRAAAVSGRGAHGLLHVRRPRRTGILQRHGRAGRLEQLSLRQSVVDHDSGRTASERSADQVRHRARL